MSRIPFETYFIQQNIFLFPWCNLAATSHGRHASIATFRNITFQLFSSVQSDDKHKKLLHKHFFKDVKDVSIPATIPSLMCKFVDGLLNMKCFQFGLNFFSLEKQVNSIIVPYTQIFSHIKCVAYRSFLAIWAIGERRRRQQH